jgi:signal-transduction protein with cAMP-binding, CBS, and nucleotidyltransferase domain
MGIEGFEDLCTRPVFKMTGCKGLSTNPVAVRCYYCQTQYELMTRKAKKGAVKFKPYIEARRLSVAMLSETPGVTAAKLQGEWTKRVEYIYATMYERALRRQVPPSFALCLCGSLARREACPYSDIDSFLLVGKSAEEDVQYFRRVGMEVRDCLLEMGGAVNGFQLCRGGLQPINIIETPDDLMSQLVDVESVDSGSHLLGIRDSPRFLYGEPQLFEQFQHLVNSAKSQDLGRTKATARANLQKLVSGASFNLPTIQGEAINIKEQLYRPVQLLLSYLSAYFGIHATDGRTQVLELTKANGMSPSFANYFINLLEDVGKLRTQNHLRAKKEDDFLILDKKKARQGDVVATDRDLDQLKACLERLARLKKLTVRFLDEYAVQRKGLEKLFSQKPKSSKNPFTGDVASQA